MSDVMRRMFVKATKTNCHARQQTAIGCGRPHRGPTITAGPKYGDLSRVSTAHGQTCVGKGRFTFPEPHPGQQALVVSH